MPEMNIPPEFEQQLRQAVDVPEPSSASLNTLRERFITQGVAQLRSPNGASSAAAAPAIRHGPCRPTLPGPGSFLCRWRGSLPWSSWSCWPCW